jgi:hypothetical protein
MLSNWPPWLLYAVPFLFNGLLLLTMYVKEKTSHYTQIAQGLDFIVWVLLFALVINALLGAWLLLRGHYGVAAVYGGFVVLIISVFWLSRG